MKGESLGWQNNVTEYKWYEIQDLILDKCD